MPTVLNTPQHDGVTRSGDMPIQDEMSSARRALIACAGAALCMAAGGLWLVPSEDAAMQLIKLLASAVLLIGGLILFNGLNNDISIPEVQIDPHRRQLRIFHYDRSGRAVLKECHDIDDLHAVSLRKQRLRAQSADGRVVLDIPLVCADQANTVRSLLPRAS